MTTTNSSSRRSKGRAAADVERTQLERDLLDGCFGEARRMIRAGNPEGASYWERCAIQAREMGEPAPGRPADLTGYEPPPARPKGELRAQVARLRDRLRRRLRRKL